MSLTWRDLVTTFFAFINMALMYAMVKGIQLPFVPGYRVAILLVGGIGIVMCALSGYDPAVQANALGRTLVSIASALGGVAFILIVFGLITGNKLAFILLTGDVIVLWIMTTLRHIFS